MKTQIITLESHDDLISVRDRLSWAKTPRILLVWPKYEKVTLRVLDLKVLQRHADSLGAQLGLVTRRANVRHDAESLGIPVFESSAAAQRDLWPEPAPRRRRPPRAPRKYLRKMRDVIAVKESPWQTSLAGRVVMFSVGVMAFLTVAGLFVPRAAVTLYPESQVQSIVVPVTANRSTTSVSLTGSIPAKELSVVVNQEQTAAITSQISVPKSKAKGVAQFTNLSQSDVTIPAGTVVFSNGATAARFVTLDETRLPAGLDKFVETPIESVSPGAYGNLDADTITAIEGNLGLSLAVTNPEPTTGGTDVKQIGATEEDRARLHESLLENLKRAAESEMRAKLAENDLLLMDTFDVVKVVNETYSPEVGQPGKELTINMQAEFSARYISAQDLDQLTLSTLDASLPVGFTAPAAPTYKPVSEPVTDSEGATHFNLEATRTLVKDINVQEIYSLTRGVAPENARVKLGGGLSSRQPPEIKIFPSWWPWMPLIPFNVSVEVK